MPRVYAICGCCPSDEPTLAAYSSPGGASIKRGGRGLEGAKGGGPITASCGPRHVSSV